MKILAYKGKSWISKAIRWQTRSPYSHIAVQLSDGSVIEAWHIGGVRHVPDPFQDHTSGTDIDVFTINGPLDIRLATYFLKEQVGKKYDFRAVARFVTRRKAKLDDRWFCSELAEAAILRGGLELLRGSPSTHSPRDTVMSPLLVFRETIRNN